MSDRNDQIRKQINKLWVRFDQVDLPRHFNLGNKYLLKWGILEIIDRLELEYENNTPTNT